MDFKNLNAAGSIGVLGASSFVGNRLLEFGAVHGLNLIPFSRTPTARGPEVDWRGLSARDFFRSGSISHWISLCPVMALAGLLPMLELAGARKLVAVSSTSLVTKKKSSDPRERRLADLLERAEIRVREWAPMAGVEVILLRTTLTYDGIRDANIAAMARFIRHWCVLPILQPATGLRQPLHAGDLAGACLMALAATNPQGCYTLSGGETLPYREMAGRVFDALKMPRRFLRVPLGLLNTIDAAGAFFPAGWRLPTSVLRRMNSDLVFDHSEAASDFGFSPRAFQPNLVDS